MPGWEKAAGSVLTSPHLQDASSCVSMPAYFRFLTLMAFHVFLQEKVGAYWALGLGLGGDSRQAGTSGGIP